jgi:glycosyltransferase involved in cell wall biosynthesis
MREAGPDSVKRSAEYADAMGRRDSRDASNRVDSPEVTLLIASLRGGGSERVCVTLANALVAQGWKVKLAALTLQGAVYAGDLDPAVSVQSLGCVHARSAAVALWRYVRAEQPARILVFNHQLAVILIAIRKLGRGNFSIVSRSINTLSEARWRQTSVWHRYFVHWLVRSIYPYVDRVVAQSEGMRDDLLKNYGLGADQVVTIRNPITASIAHASAGVPADVDGSGEKYVLCVGRLEPQKGLHFALQAFANVHEEFPGLRLKIVGSGALEAPLRALCGELKIAHLVDFEGFQRDIGGFYKNASVTVLSSLYEGFPNVLVESISVGTPVVAFACPHGPDEIIVEGVNGHLVAPGDIAALQQGIKRALTSAWHRATIARTAVPFSVARVAQQYAALLQSAARV